MTDTNVFQLCQPGAFADPLTEVLRNGARTLLAHAVEAEVAGFLSGHSDKLTGDGHQRLVRHDHRTGTCGSPTSGSRTRPHAFTHGTSSCARFESETQRRASVRSEGGSGDSMV